MMHMITRYGFLACLAVAWLQTLAQSDPSSYCGAGTLWSETYQQCVPNPAISPTTYDGDDDGCITISDVLGVLSVFGDCAPDASTIYWFTYTYEDGWPYSNGDWTDEVTDFYVMDCSIDSGYLYTTDLNMVMNFVLESPDSLVWCGNDSLYSVLQLDSLEGVSAISHDDIPNGTLTAPVYNVPFYLVIPQSFEENSLLLDQSFFDSSSCGWIQPAGPARCYPANSMATISTPTVR